MDIKYFWGNDSVKPTMKKRIFIESSRQAVPGLMRGEKKRQRLACWLALVSTSTSRQFRTSIYPHGGHRSRSGPVFKVLLTDWPRMCVITEEEDVVSWTQTPPERCVCVCVPFLCTSTPCLFLWQWFCGEEVSLHYLRSRVCFLWQSSHCFSFFQLKNIALPDML